MNVEQGIVAGGLPVATTGSATETTLSKLLDLSKYQFSDMEDATTSYFGYLDKDGNWVIKQLTSTALRYCKGASDYTTAWTGRAGLTYGYYDVIF